MKNCWITTERLKKKKMKKKLLFKKNILHVFFSVYFPQSWNCNTRYYLTFLSLKIYKKKKKKHPWLGVGGKIKIFTEIFLMCVHVYVCASNQAFSVDLKEKIVHLLSEILSPYKNEMLWIGRKKYPEVFFLF